MPGRSASTSHPSLITSARGRADVSPAKPNTNQLFVLSHLDFYDTSVERVPEPMSLLLLGAGLLAFEWRANALLPRAVRHGVMRLGERAFR